MGDIGLIAPEIILLIGGLFIFCLDVAYDPGVGKKSGLSYMALAALFLTAALIAAVLQLNIVDMSDPEATAKVAFSMMTIDNFGSFIKVTIFSGMILTAIAGGRYMNRRTGNQGEFWTFFLMVSLAMSIAASANNLVLVYLAIEFLSITSYMLTGFLRDNRRSNEAGLKYFLYGSIASAVMLYGISLLYGATGSLYLADIAAAFAEIKGDSQEISGLAFAALPAMLLVLAGLGFKASLAPFYQWAPDTYDGAPTPVATYLSTASKATGFAVLARFFVVGMASFEVNWVPVLAAFSIITMTMGNLAALRQSSVKRMLAYSSVAQAGYILMGLVAVTSASTSAMDGLNGVLLYLFVYMFTNVGAFLVVMALEEAVNSTHISAYQGLIKRAPWLAVMFTIFLLSLTGIPVTGGFFGKFYVFGAAIQRQYFWLAAVGMINAGIAAYYYLRVVRTMFFTQDDEAVALDVPMALQASLLICTIVTIWIGVYPSPVLDWVSNASVQLLTVAP